MSNVLSEEKKQQVIALGKLGWPYGASSKPPVSVEKPQALTGAESWPQCHVYLAGLGFRSRFRRQLQTVKRFVRKLRGPQRPEAAGIILTAAGEEAQVDYGRGPLVRDPHSGKYHRTRLFLMTLGYSGKSVRLLAWRSNARVWVQLHEQAFRRLGGCPRGGPRQFERRRAGSGYLRSHVNLLFRDVLAHYGIVALPCRIKNPDRKGKVESGIAHTKKTPLKGQRFESLEEAQTYLDRWEQRWADTRIHGTTKRQVAAMFAEEKLH